MEENGHIEIQITNNNNNIIWKRAGIQRANKNMKITNSK